MRGPSRSRHAVDTMPVTRPLPTQGRATTLLIVDDHDDFRRQARALLEAEGLVVIGEAADGRTALQAAAALRPDVVLLDVGLPDVDGFEVARQLAAAAWSPRVVLISSREAGTYGARLAGAAAAGFVRKDDLSAAAIAALLPGLQRGSS
jgi:DNA-binding NarL/FixJ family response regulator